MAESRYALCSKGGNSKLFNTDDIVQLAQIILTPELNNEDSI